MDERIIRCNSSYELKVSGEPEDLRSLCETRIWQDPKSIGDWHRDPEILDFISIVDL